jgi:hypothetical protein
MRRFVITISAVIMLAACGPESTPPPTDENGKALLMRKLELIFVPPFSIDSFAKTSGQNKKEGDTELYQMDFTAIVKYPSDDIRCIYPYCPQLSGGDLQAVFDKPNKSVSIKGRLTFEKTAEGWAGQM